MANVVGPFGFTQRAGQGSTPSYEFAAGFRNGAIDYATGAIYFGDPVVRTASTGSPPDGTIEQAAGSAGSGTVTLAGVFYGCKYLSTAQKRIVWSNYWPGSDVASTAQSSIEAYVVNDSNAQFLVQSDATGICQSQVGSNFDFDIGTGNAANGLSGAYLLHTPAVTVGFPWRLVGLVLDPPGAPGTAVTATSPTTTPSPYAYGVVAFNNVETKNLTAINS
jgi:hypothetical protein